MPRNVPRILVVDDTESNRYTLARYLRRAGYAVWESATGQDALRLAKDLPDLIVLDVKLPDILGFEVCAKLRKDPATASIPIMHVSATFTLSQAKVRGLEAGADAYLAGPVDPQELLANIRALLRMRDAEANLRKSEEQLKALNRDLEQLVTERTSRLQQTVADLEAFSYTISHDMRAPLRAMRGFAQMLQENGAGKLDATDQEYLTRILSAADKMDGLILDILALTRVTREDIIFEPLNLNQLLPEIIRDQPAMDPAHADITIEGTLPTMHASRPLLTQVLSNLLGNAVKFVPKGSRPKVRIFATTHKSKASAKEKDAASPEHVRINIQDNGIGIAPEYQENVFQLFTRTPEGKRYAGTGLGLSIVRKAVERMGGKVGLQSAVGQGSLFWFELPQQPPNSLA